MSTRKRIKVQNVNFWLGDHVPFEYSQHPGPTLAGERQDLLIKLYRGESTRPWYPIEAVTMEPVSREDVDWREVFKSKYNSRV